MLERLFARLLLRVVLPLFLLLIGLACLLQLALSLAVALAPLAAGALLLLTARYCYPWLHNGLLTLSRAAHAHLSDQLPSALQRFLLFVPVWWTGLLTLVGSTLLALHESPAVLVAQLLPQEAAIVLLSVLLSLVVTCAFVVAADPLPAPGPLPLLPGLRARLTRRNDPYT